MINKRLQFIFFVIICFGYGSDAFCDQKKFLEQFIKPGDLVFDVGANYGEKTAWYVVCGARVVCFEPQQECINVLKNKYANSPIVAIEHMGLASQEGILEFHRCSAGNSISTFSQEWIENSRFAGKHVWDDKFLVPVSTLDIMIKKYGKPQFCKIDVEGFEYEVIKGLSQPIPSLSFESHVEMLHQTKCCLDHLSSLGKVRFNFAVAVSEEWLFSEWYPADVFFVKLSEMANQYWKELAGGLFWGDVYAVFQD